MTTLEGGGREWVEATTMGDLAEGRRVFIAGREVTIPKTPEQQLAELRKKLFELAEAWSDPDYQVTSASPKDYAYELKMILA